MNEKVEVSQDRKAWVAAGVYSLAVECAKFIRVHNGGSEDVAKLIADRVGAIYVPPSALEIK